MDNEQWHINEMKHYPGGKKNESCRKTDGNEKYNTT